MLAAVLSRPAGGCRADRRRLNKAPAAHVWRQHDRSSARGSALRKPLRLWPGVALGVLILVLRYVTPQIAPPAVRGRHGAAMSTLFSFLGALLASILVLLWWLLFSRAPWVDRLLALGLVAVGFLAGPLVQDVSITTGAMGMLYPILVIPIVALAFVAWAALTRHLPDGVRRMTMAAAILLAFASLGLIRTGGFTAGMKHDFAWRWTPTPEERLLAAEPSVPSAAPAAAAAPAPTPAPGAAPASAPAAVPTPATTATRRLPPRRRRRPVAADGARAADSAAPPAPVLAEWPGFRGPGRDGIVRGTRVATDWSATPPVALWRRAVGPGWSSFAVAGNRVYTQEQRGEDEVVACYDASSGAPVWHHRDRARFWESNGGAGPRGTPTLSGGRVYALGATGVVNALDAATGARVWSRNAADRHRREASRLGLLRLADRRGRSRRRRGLRRARRVRRRHRPAALEARPAGRRLQLAAPRHARRRAPGRVRQRRRHHRRRAVERRRAVGQRVEGLSHRAAGGDRGRRPAVQRQGTTSACAASR